MTESLAALSHWCDTKRFPEPAQAVSSRRHGSDDNSLHAALVKLICLHDKDRTSVSLAQNQ